MQETPVLLNRLYFPVLFSLILCMLVSACTATRPAPVIERAPASKSAAKPTDKDWRPDTYTVKKGDTLYSIGLEYGYDYKDIAEANHLQSPYTIYIGQQLSFKQIKGVPTATVKNVSTANDGGVIIKPLNTEVAPAPTKPTAAAPAPVLTGESLVLKEPKAIKEPYSTQALATPPTAPTAAKPATSAPPALPVTAAPVVAATAKPADTPPAATGDDEDIDWAWPANGKLISGFNDAESAKGIDIAGSQGQAVLAAAAGKVIYSGSDLRGYGKLVIIKHNKTYLSVYAHNSAIVIKEGQQVAKGQKIAEMGNSDADQVKLHFEIRRQGKSVDPAKYLSGSP